MILYDFDYAQPDTLDEAVSLLDGAGGSARLLAGGTDLLPNMRLETVKPDLLIGLGAITPEPPRLLDDSTLRISALSRLADLDRSALVRDVAPMLALACRAVGGHQVREMGTLGGNLCQETRCLYLNQKHDFQFVAPCFKIGGACCYPFPNSEPDLCRSVYMSDTAPALIALGAELDIVGPGGGRRLPVEQFFTGNGMQPLALEPSEIIRAIDLPAARPNSGWGFHKATVRGGLEFAMVVMATVLNLRGDGETCAEARIVVGAVAEGPARSAAAEAMLQNSRLDDETLTQAAAAAATDIRVLPHHGFSKSHLVDTIKVRLRRILAEARARAHGE